MTESDVPPDLAALGMEFTQGPLRFNADGMATMHNADFLNDPLFIEAYRLAMATGHVFGPDVHIEWRVYTACWIATNAIRRPGDFVECGVASGMISRAIAHYVGWEKYPQKTFWLLDTFSGFPDEFESSFGAAASHLYSRNSLELINQNFAAYPNVQIVPGVIPHTLSDVTAKQIAYLHIDLNSPIPERGAIEEFWPRLVHGGWVLLDDYGWNGCLQQKETMDDFAESQGLAIFSMPTGQGILIKP